MSSTLHPDRRNNPDPTTSNESGNPSLHDLIETGRFSRHAFLQGSLGLTAGMKWMRVSAPTLTRMNRIASAGLWKSIPGIQEARL